MGADFTVDCCVCQRVRQPDGEWVHVDPKLIRDSFARLSHGLCDECCRLTYPECFPGDRDTPPPEQPPG